MIYRFIGSWNWTSFSNFMVLLLLLPHTDVDGRVDGKMRADFILMTFLIIKLFASILYIWNQHEIYEFHHMQKWNGISIWRCGIQWSKSMIQDIFNICWEKKSCFTSMEIENVYEMLCGTANHICRMRISVRPLHYYISSNDQWMFLTVLNGFSSCNAYKSTY